MNQQHENVTESGIEPKTFPLLEGLKFFTCFQIVHLNYPLKINIYQAKRLWFYVQWNNTRDYSSSIFNYLHFIIICLILKKVFLSHFPDFLQQNLIVYCFPFCFSLCQFLSFSSMSYEFVFITDQSNFAEEVSEIRHKSFWRNELNRIYSHISLSSLK